MDTSHIVDLLEDPTSQAEGLHLLDTLLTELVPDIVTWRKTLDMSPKLQRLLRSQDSFETNLTQALLEVYTTHDESLLLTANRLLQGLLLLHPELRNIFSRQKNMRLIIESLALSKLVELDVSIVSLLIHILLKKESNFRVFEKNDGCGTIIKKLKLDNALTKTVGNGPLTQQDLNFKVIEFLVFYFEEDGLLLEEKVAFFREDFDGIDELVESLDELKNL